MKSSGKYKLLVLTLAILLLPLAKNTSMTLFASDLFETYMKWDKQNDVKVILIDPGHGGKDHGCSGNHLREKDVALQLAFKVGRLIQENYREIEIRYTRDKDIFIPLHQRVKMANQEDVDLFISLHCNAVSSPKAHGIETYVMGVETSQENLEIANRENDVILLEDLETYNPYTEEGHIMLAMMQQQTLEKSIQLASYTQNELASVTSFRDRGVKQAGFVVLRKVLVPSMLIEAGFISNPEDASRLKEQQEQNKIAHSIVSGVGKYIDFYQTQ